jgi:hypothetical protein
MKRSSLILVTAGIILAGSAAIEVLDNVVGPAATPVAHLSDHHHVIGNCH